MYTIDERNLHPKHHFGLSIHVSGKLVRTMWIRMENNLYMPTDQRRTLLKKRYGFTCQCIRCDPLITPEAAGVTSLQLIKRKRSERMLEAMKCPSCCEENNGDGTTNSLCE